MNLLHSFSALTLAGFLVGAAGAATPASDVFDRQLKGMEREFVPLVEAMPAEKFGFAPTLGSFKGVRTFALEARHAAYVLNEVSAALLGDKPPANSGQIDNGPDSLDGKDAIVKYVKEAFVYAHKAIATLTNDNLMQEIKDPFDSKSKSTRVGAASILLWHTYDHYGQMVEYLRMNGIIPPASR